MTPYRVEGGYSVSGGACKGGWYAGVLALDDFDFKAYVAGTPDDYSLRVKRCRELQEITVGKPRRVTLVTSTGSGCLQTELASAARIDGPVCPKEPVAGPTLAWTERGPDGWSLKLFLDGSIQVVARQKGMLRNPCVAAASTGLFLACERDSTTHGAEVVLLRGDGSEVLRVPGRNPVLAATAVGVVLMTEHCSRNGIFLRLYRVIGGLMWMEEIRHGDYCFNADLAWSGVSEEMFVVAESCPAFGEGCQVGKHRDICAWRFADGHVASFPGEGLNTLPVEKRAFQSVGPENLPPIRPQVFVEAGKPTVVFRQFRYHGFKTFGWDVFWSRTDGAKWTPPARVSPCMILPDTASRILPVGGRYIGMFPALEQDGGAGRTYGQRVEFTEFDASVRLERFEVDAAKARPYAVTSGYKDIAIDPPQLRAPYPGLTLIWGDMHMHTAYSKCMGAVDGSPAERLRFARDSLGCRVFTLTEHTQDLSRGEQVWCMDQLEKGAGDQGIVLYCSEPPFSPGRHTNVYARDRDVYDRLLAIVISQKGDRRLEYRHIRDELPPGSVFVMQHFHGDITGKEEMLASFDPVLEVAMEAMQGRCNGLLENDGGALPFPAGFLDLGCKIGLVGGTDHFRSGPNRLGLTGFWVKEVSADGVWEAIRSRHTIAMSNAKIAMAATLNGQMMGSSVRVDKAAPVRIELSASCGRKIRRATLIKDGAAMPWVEVGDCSAAIELTDAAPGPGRHWYVPTVEVDTAFGADTPGYGHTSPFFVTNEADS